MAVSPLSPIAKAQAELDRLDGQNQQTTEQNTDSGDNAGTTEGQQSAAGQEDNSNTGGQEFGQRKPESQGEGQQQQRQQSSGEDDPDSPTYKQRWQSLQGNYRKSQEKIDALEDERKELKQTLDSLKEQVSELMTGKQQEQQQQAKDSENELIGTMSEEVGEKFTDSMVRYLESQIEHRIRQAVPELLKQTLPELLEGKVSNIEQEISSVREDSRSTKQVLFEKDLTSSVPDWREILASPSFGEWAQSQTEEFSGKTYAQLFDEANKAWDLQRIVKLMTAFKQATGRQDTPAKGEQKRDPREEMVSADSGRGDNSSPAQQTSQKTLWNRDKINEFYDQVRRGAYRGREDEMQRIEQEIMEANFA